MRKITFLIFSIISLSTLNGCAAIAIGTVAVVAGVATIIATDPRHSGTIVDDNTIATKLQSKISNNYPDSNIYVTCYNGVVLLTGQATTIKARDGAKFDAKTIPGVKQIYSYLDIRLPQSVSSKTDDSYTTTQVKTKLIGINDLNSNNVKVVTTNSVVYLLGVVSPTQAKDIAANVANISGVDKVVTLFEYTS